MKKIIILSAQLFTSICLNAQIFKTETFEGLTSVIDSGQVLNGKSTLKKYESKFASFQFDWDTSYGGYWAKNWAASRVIYNKEESSDYARHLYAAKPGYGCESADYDFANYSASKNVFLVGQNNSGFSLNPTTGIASQVVQLRISNSTYAYNSMKFGDFVGKKFSAADKDSFVLIITGFSSSQKKFSKRVYLADYRFNDLNKNFMLDTWQLVKFNQNETADSLAFTLESSDNGQFGMNTPAFFVMDNVTIADFNSSINKIATKVVRSFPNPATNSIQFEIPSAQTNVMIYQSNGTLSKQTQIQSNFDIVNIDDLSAGLYVVKMQNALGQTFNTKFIKQ
jgi:hypothetical protein